jgi:hypothetical protein
MFVTAEVKMVQKNGDFTAKKLRAVMKYIFLTGNKAKKTL